MAKSDFERIFEGLAAAKVRYLVVGGVAVVLHGHPRFTADLDLVLALQPDNVKAAMGALASLRFQPRIPVAAEEFADPATRESWVREKGMVVFTLSSPELPATQVDVFIQEPFPYDDMEARSRVAWLGGTSVRVAALADLIAMKRAAGRPVDLADVEALEAISRIEEESKGG